jgi:Sec-independent protein translocase protein TatA
MGKTITELKERMKALRDEKDDLLKVGEREDRELTDEEVLKIEEIEAEIQELEEEIK